MWVAERALPPRMDRPAVGLGLPCLGRSDVWEDPARTAEAQAGCAMCPVRDWCERQANATRLAGMELDGVWAGSVYAADTASSGVV